MALGADADWNDLDWAGLRWSGAGRLISAPNQARLLADLETCLSEGTGFALATLNLDHVVKLRRDPAFARAYAAQTHVTADGKPILWMERLAGRPVELITGSGFVGPMAALAAKCAAPVAFFGARAETLEAAKTVLEQRFPGLRVVAQIAPPMGFDPTSPEAEALIAELVASGARVAFLALGAPKQEMLAARIRALHPEVGCLSIGAGLDFVAGSQTRAPVWVRQIAMEWLWRLGQDPARLWRRYAQCALILPLLTWRALRQRKQAG